MGITETRISNANSLDYNASIPGYKFEYSPTPLAAGGVGMYIDEDLNYCPRRVLAQRPKPEEAL